MARAEALRLGPFIGGLNAAMAPTAVADSELVECVNFELDLDSSMISRPPIVETVTNNAWTQRVNIIGRGTFSGSNYIIASNDSGTYAFNGTVWTTIKANLQSQIALQFFGYMWIVPKPGSSGTQKGGRWEPTGGFVADTNMPEGESAIFHKTRMFICPGIATSAGNNESRLRFTDPITSSTLAWTSTNNIDVSPGDGQNLIDIVIKDDNLLLFKNDSTYLLAYDIRPADAILRQINSVIGVSKRRCIVSYENSIFVFHEGRIFEIVNYDFARINLQVPFILDGTAPSTRVEDVFLCLLGDRMIARYFNKIYVFGLKTRTWTTWSAATDVLHNFGPLVPFPTNSPQDINVKHYAGSSINSFTNMIVIQDGYDVSVEKTLSTTYDITCFLRTKNYDLADSHHFKRMMWWGADLYTTRNIIGTATPVIANFRAKWGDLTTWGAMLTWGNPLADPISIKTNASSGKLGAIRIFVKFLKSIRFRQINFALTLLNDGSVSQGPCRVFSLTAMIGSKQTVSKQVT